jgi:purine-binding chemotaxis protein CheW
VTGDTISMCSLRTGGDLFGIDTRRIREVLRRVEPQRVPMSPKFIAGVAPYRGEVLTTVSFRALLGLEDLPNPGHGSSCVMVFDEEGGERFGLMVDAMCGVVTMRPGDLEPSPAGLDARGLVLFDGACKMQQGLMVRLDPGRLEPTRLAATGLFE